jgi:hypothetical protein
LIHFDPSIYVRTNDVPFLDREPSPSISALRTAKKQKTPRDFGIKREDKQTVRIRRLLQRFFLAKGKKSRRSRRRRRNQQKERSRKGWSRFKIRKEVGSKREFSQKHRALCMTRKKKKKNVNSKSKKRLDEEERESNRLGRGSSRHKQKLDWVVVVVVVGASEGKTVGFLGRDWDVGMMDGWRAALLCIRGVDEGQTDEARECSTDVCLQTSAGSRVVKFEANPERGIRFIGETRATKSMGEEK